MVRRDKNRLGRDDERRRHVCGGGRRRRRSGDNEVLEGEIVVEDQPSMIRVNLCWGLFQLWFQS